MAEEQPGSTRSCRYGSTAHWRLGSAGARMSSIRLGTLYRSNPGPLFRDFNTGMRLRSRGPPYKAPRLRGPKYSGQF
jgi:hypothetical protein